MTLADKRKVIEVLLCCGDPQSPDGTSEVTASLGLPRRIQKQAFDAWSPVEREPQYADDWSRNGIANAYTEAAYRLIESSPTLRKKWFGAP